ncbi:MAG: tripartite tricarboxylate transporter TctB family protein [Desulfobacteraceae bacterium]|nr:MAG: tripartite tricarboxylate transporter TctB family protein [Desulfobacteraceae bacterium]
MRKLDIQSGIFLLLASVAICVGSLQHEVGSLTEPGSGFFPLVTGLVLGVLAILILIEGWKKEQDSAAFWSPAANKMGIFLTIVFILVFSFLLEWAGFLITTTLFFLLVSRFVSHHRWSTALFFGLAASISTYVVFNYLLRAPLPGGIVERIF